MQARSRPSLALLFAIALSAGSGAAAPRDEDRTFFDTVDVHVVNVEVIVLDRRQQPVRGLGKEDFELLEDGEPVEISNFYSVDGAPEPPALADPGPPADRQQDPVAAAQQLHLAVFVDGSALEPINRRHVFGALRALLGGTDVRPATLTLASFDGRLELSSVPDPHPAQVEAYLEELEAAATGGAVSEMDRRFILSELTRAVEPSEIAMLLETIDAYAERLYTETRASTAALESVVEALAALPGRKALVYVSGGLTRHPGEALYYAWEQRFPEESGVRGAAISTRARRLDTSAELLRLIAHANANRVTFYTLGAGRGGQPGGPVTAESGSFQRNWTAGIEATDNANLAGTLQELAAATGGLSMTNSRNFDRLLAAMSRDFQGYYSLGYSPDRERDGKNHRLRVRVKGGDYTIRHRENYRERTVSEVMTGRTRSAALLESSVNPLGVSIEFGATAAGEGGRLLVPAMIKVPLDRLVILPQGKTHVGRIAIYICARDRKGRISPVQSVEVPIQIPAARLGEALRQVAGYRMALLLRREEHVVAVAVRDELGKVESAVTSPWQPSGGSSPPATPASGDRRGNW